MVTEARGCDPQIEIGGVAADGKIALQKIPQYRLNKTSNIQVLEGIDGTEVKAGFAYVAPGNDHMSTQREGTRLGIKLTGRELSTVRNSPLSLCFHPSL